jgi:hypothetical protein
MPGRSIQRCISAEAARLGGRVRANNSRLRAIGSIGSLAIAVASKHMIGRWMRYPRNLHIRFHGDDWRARHQRHYHWRQDRDDDHGYYTHGNWHTFDH